MTSRTARDFLRLPYSLRVVPDEGTFGETLYLASVEELPGCQSHGQTPEEALVNLREAMELYLETLLEDGLEPPEPQQEGISVTWRSLPALNVSRGRSPVRIEVPPTAVLSQI